MIGVEFKGRMGNQLFQYCFLLYLKEQNPKHTYFFPNPHHAQQLTKYFDLGWYHNLTLSSKTYSIIMHLLPKIFRFNDLWFYGFVGPKPVIPQPWTINHGYWQTDWYLKQVKRHKLPQLKTKWKKKFEDEFGALLSKKTIVVHIRLTDYRNFLKRDLSLPLSYYKQQLDAIEDITDYHVVFVSDDISVVKDYFGEKENFIFSSNDEITDFQLIMHADIAIIANSTFSWWAAYLNPKKKTVIAPRYFLAFRIGTEFPRGIMTDRFTWKDVT